jgi:hypothetical protein
VDWSGAVTGEGADGIRLAHTDDPARTPHLERGRGRTATIDRVLDLLAAEPDAVVGLDFSFGLAAPHDTTVDWHDVDRHEAWLAACDAPFWGRPGRRRPVGQHEWRRTEALARADGLAVKSTFQIGGAGSVGTGSLRGWRHLARLRAEGVAVWPFDEATPGRPVAVEIYPRACTGPVVKRSPAARAAWLAAHGIDPTDPRTLVETEDDFDALVSAAFLADRMATAPGLPHDEPLARTEGWIWRDPSAALQPAFSTPRLDRRP